MSFTGRVAGELLANKNIGAWIAAVFPVSRKPVLPPPQWEVGTPSFLPLIIEYGEFSEDDKAENIALIATWQDAILNDALSVRA